ncbi:hypothetical protein CY34DRAFT_782391, partial [Suillus luteus UH-Slu-Lm8-n1]
LQIPQTGEVHCLPRITFSFNPARSNWTVNRKQFLLRPAYATTFNGSQGLTSAGRLYIHRHPPVIIGRMLTHPPNVHR